MITDVQQLLYTFQYKIKLLNMIVVGLLSSQKEVEELKYIAKICTLEGRIRFICRMQKLKDMQEKEKQSPFG